MWQVDCEKIGKKRTVKGICRNGTLESEPRWQKQKNQPTKECYCDKLPSQNVHALVAQEKGWNQKEEVKRKICPDKLGDERNTQLGGYVKAEGITSLHRYPVAGWVNRKKCDTYPKQPVEIRPPHTIKRGHSKILHVFDSAENRSKHARPV